MIFVDVCMNFLWFLAPRICIRIQNVTNPNTSLSIICELTGKSTVTFYVLTFSLSYPYKGYIFCFMSFCRVFLPFYIYSLFPQIHLGLSFFVSFMTFTFDSFLFFFLKHLIILKLTVHKCFKISQQIRLSQRILDICIGLYLGCTTYSSKSVSGRSFMTANPLQLTHYATMQW